ncbi:hypothetical protein RJ639_007686 [Escallonia herrerae]|uniref:Uncharacterized protein n=1 Tax=Escallonia herrerae TaxID=1293975 RepID=A0AA88VY20_9ASTE|nr:hypothetical protein RJ639_007686 [Escallonia herrerae]
MEEVIRIKVDEMLGSEEIKLETERRIQEGRKKLFDDVEAQLWKEKEAALIEARRKELTRVAHSSRLHQISSRVDTDWDSQMRGSGSRQLRANTSFINISRQPKFRRYIILGECLFSSSDDLSGKSLWVDDEFLRNWVQDVNLGSMFTGFHHSSPSSGLVELRKGVIGGDLLGQVFWT